jgi:hypothetical protein
VGAGDIGIGGGGGMGEDGTSVAAEISQSLRFYDDGMKEIWHMWSSFRCGNVLKPTCSFSSFIMHCASLVSTNCCFWLASSKRLFCAISVLKSQNTERLPRQARDKHTGKVDKETFLFRSENKMNELKEHASRARTADDDERSVHPYFEDIRKTARQERCAENAFP